MRGSDNTCPHRRAGAELSDDGLAFGIVAFQLPRFGNGQDILRRAILPAMLRPSVAGRIRSSHGIVHGVIRGRSGSGMPGFIGGSDGGRRRALHAFPVGQGQILGGGDGELFGGQAGLVGEQPAQERDGQTVLGRVRDTVDGGRGPHGPTVAFRLIRIRPGPGILPLPFGLRRPGPFGGRGRNLRHALPHVDPGLAGPRPGPGDARRDGFRAGLAGFPVFDGIVP